MSTQDYANALSGESNEIAPEPALFPLMTQPAPATSERKQADVQRIPFGFPEKRKEPDNG